MWELDFEEKGRNFLVIKWKFLFLLCDLGFGDGWEKWGGVNCLWGGNCGF